MIYDDLFWINMIYEDLWWFLIIFDDDDDVNDDCGAWATHLDVDDGDLNGDGKDDDCEHQDVDSSDANNRIIMQFLSCIFCIFPLRNPHSCIFQCLKLDCVWLGKTT